MDIFGMIKKLGEGVGQAVATGASQAGRAVGVKPAGKSAGAKPAGRPVATPAGRSVPGVQPIGASAGAYPAGRGAGFTGIGAQATPPTPVLPNLVRPGYNDELQSLLSQQPEVYPQPGLGMMPGAYEDQYQQDLQELPIYTRRRR